MDADELLTRFAELLRDDPAAAEALIEQYPRSANALRLYELEQRIARLQNDLASLGWFTTKEAARYSPYSERRIQELAHSGAIGPMGTHVRREPRWPGRTFISPEALANLVRRRRAPTRPPQDKEPKE